MPAPITQPEFVITLVHGTWGRKNEFDALKLHLSRSLHAPVKFYVFRWSGKNSVRRRAQAARHLEVHLRSAFETYPSAAHYAVAHSHGGNVVFKALADRAVQSRMAGVACLSTPFLVMRERHLGVTYPWVFAALGGLAAGMAVLYPIQAYVGELTGPYQFLGVLPLTSAAIAALLPYFLRRWVEGLKNDLHLPTLPSDMVVIVRSTADEASATLATAQFAAWALTRAWGLLPRLMVFVRRIAQRHRTLVTMYAVIVVAMLVLDLVLTIREQQADSLTTVVVWLIVPILYPLFIVCLVGACTFVPLLMLVSILLIPYGWELGFLAPLVELSVEPTPTGSWTVVQVSASSESGSGLAHSASYSDPRVLARIGDWIVAGRTAARPT